MCYNRNSIGKCSICYTQLGRYENEDNYEKDLY